MLLASLIRPYTNGNILSKLSSQRFTQIKGKCKLNCTVFEGSYIQAKLLYRFNMSQDSTEQRPLLSHEFTPLSLRFRWFASAAMPLFLILQLFRLASCILFTIFVTDCLLEKQQTSVDCQNFTMYRDPYKWKTTWLSCSVLTSLCMLFALCNRFVPEIRPRKNLNILRILLKKPYFWSYTCLLCLVIGYDTLIIFQNKSCKKHIEILLIFLKIATMTLVFQLNFTFPPSQQRNFARLTTVCYYFALLLYVLENTVKALTSTAQIAFKLYTVDRDLGIHPIEMVDLMLMASSAALYNYFLQFFWEKMFRGSKDILTIYRGEFVDTLNIAGEG